MKIRTFAIFVLEMNISTNCYLQYFFTAQKLLTHSYRLTTLYQNTVNPEQREGTSPGSGQGSGKGRGRGTPVKSYDRGTPPLSQPPALARTRTGVPTPILLAPLTTRTTTGVTHSPTRTGTGVRTPANHPLSPSQDQDRGTPNPLLARTRTGVAPPLHPVQDQDSGSPSSSPCLPPR